MSLPLRTSNRTKKPKQNESTGIVVGKSIDKNNVLEFKNFMNDKSETTSNKILKQSNRTKKPKQNESTGIVVGKSIDKNNVLEFKNFMNDKSETTSKKMLKQNNKKNKSIEAETIKLDAPVKPRGRPPKHSLTEVPKKEQQVSKKIRVDINGNQDSAQTIDQGGKKIKSIEINNPPESKKKQMFVESPKDIENNVENNKIFQLQEKIYNETITEDDVKKLKKQEEENEMLKKRVAQLENMMLKKNKMVPTMNIPVLNPTPTNLVSLTWPFSGVPSLFPQQWTYLPILPIPPLFNQQWTGGYSGFGINNPELIPFVNNPPNAYYNAQFHHRFY